MFYGSTFTCCSKPGVDAPNCLGLKSDRDEDCSVGDFCCDSLCVSRKDHLGHSCYNDFKPCQFLRSSERILIWCSCGTKAEIFKLSLATANEPPLLILSGAPRPGNWTAFDSGSFP